MKNILIMSCLIAAMALLGCGKSAEMKKMEGELDAAIMKLHETEMGTMNQVDGLVAQIDAALHDSLTAKNPKLAEGQAADDLKAAKEKLSAAKASLHAWMKDYKPYDEKMKHEEVMVNLTKDKDALVKVKTYMEAAITAATAALNSYKQAEDKLIAETAAHVKKGKN
jgi:hypothetical protein